MRKIVLSLVLVTGIVEDSEQCLSKVAITEEVDETPVQIEQHGVLREKEPNQLVVQRSVHRGLFRQPQHLLHGFTPVTAEKRENVQSYTKKASHQLNANPKQDNIELVNIPGPPYNHQAENQLHPQNTADQNPSSVKFQSVKLPHGSGNNPLKQHSESPKRNPSRPDPFKYKIKTLADLRKKLNTFIDIPGFESFIIDFGPN